MMGSIERLSVLIKEVGRHRDFRQSHVCLYAALLICHFRASGQSAFRVSRREVMCNATIRSFATYHKCIKDLIDWGFIEYEPSYHPKLGSLVRLLR